MPSPYACLIASILLLSPLALSAQTYQYEVGLGAGISSAYGDINAGRLFYKPSVALEGQLRYVLNKRWAFVGELLYAGLRGDSKDFQGQFPQGVHDQFETSLFQLGLRSEFHFLNYGIGPAYEQYHRFSPFLSLGLGAGVAVTDQETNFSFAIPLGFGLKYRLTERVGVHLRLDLAKQLTDLSDGIEDPYGIVSGFAKNTDWYSTLTFGISYQWGQKEDPCMTE